MISYEVANDKIGHVSWFNDFIGRFSRATKSLRQKLANFIDHMSTTFQFSAKIRVVQGGGCRDCSHELQLTKIKDCKMAEQGHRNGSRRPGACRTFYVHIISIFENVS